MSAAERFSPNQLREPIVLAPMAGGPATVELAAAVAGAGGLGFIAGGYKQPEALREQITALRAASERPFGVNLFAPGPKAADQQALRRYLAELAVEAERQHAPLGEPRHDDDHYAAKLDLVCELQVPLVSFTFGCPQATVIERLHRAGAAVWVTVTSVAEARAAHGAGADALVAQGAEAGGHRSSFNDAETVEDVGLIVLLRLIRSELSLPLIAAGGIADGAALAAALCAGASAAVIGTALMLAPEAGTTAPHRQMLGRELPTTVTRAFSGRRGRGLVNRFITEHDANAPSGYPEINHATSALRAAARSAGDTGSFNLWAGQAHTLAKPLPAAEIVRTLGADARAILADTSARLARPGQGAGAR